MKTQPGRTERGRLPLQLAMAFAVSMVVAVLAGAFGPQRWAAAGDVSEPFHGISFAKGCAAPTIAGEPYRCIFTIRNTIDDAPDTLTVTSLVDVVAANPDPVSSGNVLPTLSLGFTGGASCDVGQTKCTLPPGSGILTTAALAFYTTDADDPNPLTDQAVLTWQDLCDSEVENCPVGDQTANAGSQSPLWTPTPTNTPPRNTSTPHDRDEPPNTPTKTNTPTPVSSVAPATVVPPHTPTQVPAGTITLPDTGSSSGGNSNLLVGLMAGVGTLGLLLVMGRVRSLRVPRYRGKP